MMTNGTPLVQPFCGGPTAIFEGAVGVPHQWVAVDTATLPDGDGSGRTYTTVTRLFCPGCSTILIRRGSGRVVNRWEVCRAELEDGR